MPPRWLAPRSRSQTRGRIPKDDQPSKPETTQTPKWKDFHFLDDALPPRLPILGDDRPKTSSGADERSKSRSRPYLGITSSLKRPRTSDGPRPSSFAPPNPLDSSHSPSKVDDGTIGMAFGSPTHPPANDFGTLNNLAPSTYEESIFEQREPVYQIKGRQSKWKKFGALFKSHKSSTAQLDTFEVPFYKVRIEEKTREKSPIRRSPTPPPKDEDRRSSITARLAEARLEVARLEEIIADPSNASIEIGKDKKDVIEKGQVGSKIQAALPKLEVNIPTITMDKYNTKFSSPQDNKPNSKLLTRRSKTLERLKPVTDKEVDVDAIDEIPTPDTSTLSPRLDVPRRATSPSSSGKSTAGFSLFPQASLTPSQSTRTLATPSPGSNLRRSVTSPARLSPMVEAFETIKPQLSHTTLKRSETERAVTSPSDTTASTDPGAPWSADGRSSPTTTVTTIDEEILLTPQKPISKPLVQTSDPIQPSVPECLSTAQDSTTKLLAPGQANSPDESKSGEISRSQSTAFNSRITSNVFNKAIAEIEALAVSASQPMPTGPAAYVPITLSLQNETATPAMTEKLLSAHFKPVSGARLMATNMPSPITEASEDSPAGSPAKLIVKPGTKTTMAKPSQSNPLARALARPEQVVETVVPPAPQRTPPPVPPVLNMSPQEHNLAPKRTKPEFTVSPPVSRQRAFPPREQSLPTKVAKSKFTVEPPYLTKTIPRHEQSPAPKPTRQEFTVASTASLVKPVTQEQSPVSPSPKIETAPKTPIPAISTASVKSPLKSTLAPRVPTKDSKYAPNASSSSLLLPISRFAAKGTAANVTSKTGITPDAPKPKILRSVTEPGTINHVGESYRKPDPTPIALRSLSDENLERGVTNPAAKGTAASILEKMGLEKPSVMTVTAVVKPVPIKTGETVGVARTVSLSRKQSQRVLVKRKESIKERICKSSEEKEKENPKDGEEVKPKRPRAGTGGGGLQRAESFKRAKEVGKDELKSSGEERARALSPVVISEAEHMGHRAQRSCVGVVEDASS